MFRNVGLRVGVEIWRAPVDRALYSAVSSLSTRRASTIGSRLRQFSSHRHLPHPTFTSTASNAVVRRPVPGTLASRPGFTVLRQHGTSSRAWNHLRLQSEEQNLSALARAAWRRYAHHKARRKSVQLGVRNKSSTSRATKADPASKPSTPKAEPSPKPSSTSSNTSNAASKGAVAAGSKSFFDRLPHMPQTLHRPTKEDLLAAATGFWSRLRARFKWFTIRSGRPFNIDEITALFSWVLLGHVVWIIVGTTTFFSLAIFVVNTVFAQETLAQSIGNYLTQSSGIKVVFESAVVPKWGSGVISFKKVFVSRRPGQGDSKVSKGSQAEAAAVAARAALGERSNDENLPDDEDANYTQFDLSIDTVDVTLSFAKWFNGKGLLKDVEMSGVRGVVDRTSVVSSGQFIDPKSYRKDHNYGDFELDSFKLSDLLVTVYQPRDFRPYTVSIYSCDLPQLRKQWLFYDFLSANTISGSFDNSLFTIHPRQTHNYTGLQLDEGAEWKKNSRIRIDNLSIDHLNRGIEGPFSWIHEGNVDIVADILLPADNDASIAKVMSDFYDRMEATVTSNSLAQQINPNDLPPESQDLAIRNDKVVDLTEPEELRNTSETTDDKRFLIMDIRVHLNDVRAAVPLFTKDISYVNNALIRPIVAYINSKRSFIPVNCRVVKRVSDFDGSWTIYDSGLMDDLSQEMYEAFARDVINDKQARKRRFRKVGVWTLQLAAQALFLGLAGNVA